MRLLRIAFPVPKIQFNIILSSGNREKITYQWPCTLGSVPDPLLSWSYSHW